MEWVGLKGESRVVGKVREVWRSGGARYVWFAVLRMCDGFVDAGY